MFTVFASTMSLDQLRAFLIIMQHDEKLMSDILTASNSDDDAKYAVTLGYEFSGDELLRQSGKQVGQVTVFNRQPHDEYH